jgi:hypothetical protein
MFGMAIETGRRVGVTLGSQHAVDSRLVLPDRLCVANAAVHRLGGALTGSGQARIHIGVALGTGRAGVQGGRICLFIHKERDRVPGNGAETLQEGISMAGEAVLVGGTRAIKNTPLLVGLVAVHTCGDLVGFLFPEPSLDDLDVDRFDPGVALCAGGSHPFAGDAGTGIGVGEDVVRRVTGGAHRRHRQPCPI